MPQTQMSLQPDNWNIRSSPFGFNDVGIIKSEFVPKENARVRVIYSVQYSKVWRITWIPTGESEPGSRDKVQRELNMIEYLIV